LRGGVGRTRGWEEETGGKRGSWGNSALVVRGIDALDNRLKIFLTSVEEVTFL